MGDRVSVGIIGDLNPGSFTHAATTRSLEDAARIIGVSVEVSWLPTASLRDSAQTWCRGFDALWAAPGSVESLEGAVEGIRYAREQNVPYIGTCGGFQSTVVEFARNVLGKVDASHAEYDPSAREQFVSPLSCSLVGTKSRVVISSGSRVESIYGTCGVEEEYRCNYGMSPGRRKDLEDAGLVVTGVDDFGEPRIVESPGHDFYIATLFVPQLSSSYEEPHPLVVEMLRVALG